jgi:uncharacterized protein Yka (UPF0111/DUF47 family)
MDTSSRREGKKGVLDSIFPPRYDFYGTLRAQADQTRAGVRLLVEWLNLGGVSAPEALLDAEQRADDLRHEMEAQLLEAFSTPFDRQDIYSISRQMDYILNYSLSTAQEMRAFKVAPDEAIMSMAEALQEGTELVAEAVRLMENDGAKADALIKEMRRKEHEIETIYIGSMSVVFENDDVIPAIKKREIYHHLKDAGRTMSITTDILHRIIVGQS